MPGLPMVNLKIRGTGPVPSIFFTEVAIPMACHNIFQRKWILLLSKSSFGSLWADMS
jgi:hypothetical protein